MAKAIRLFFGHDSYGRPVERAQRFDGVWFARSYGFNGYHNCWSKWEQTEEPSFETHGVNAYSGERFEYTAPVCMWGWNKLTEATDKLRVRLPG